MWLAQDIWLNFWRKLKEKFPHEMCDAIKLRVENSMKVTTLAGSPGKSGDKDGRGEEALFNCPMYF
jgi:hypothetical protein